MTGTLRDPDNMSGFLREAVKGTRGGKGCTRMPSAAWSPLNSTGPAYARQIAEYLGHERVIKPPDADTNRKATGSSAAAALDGLARRLGEQK